MKLKLIICLSILLSAMTELAIASSTNTPNKQSKPFADLEAFYSKENMQKLKQQAAPFQKYSNDNSPEAQTEFNKTFDEAPINFNQFKQGLKQLQADMNSPEAKARRAELDQALADAKKDLENLDEQYIHDTCANDTLFGWDLFEISKQQCISSGMNCLKQYKTRNEMLNSLLSDDNKHRACILHSNAVSTRTYDKVMLELAPRAKAYFEAQKKRIYAHYKSLGMPVDKFRKQPKHSPNDKFEPYEDLTRKELARLWSKN